jgi:ATP-binding cassette, subfamily C (CFTR/MRP), member 1
MLDDVFSGLDNTSEERIFSRLLGSNGLLRRLGTTIILVTHAAHRLSYADHIIALTPQGNIAEQGTFDELLTNDGYVAGFAAHHVSEAEDEARNSVPPAKTTESSDVTRQNAAADLNRPVGNWAVYSYYFASAGRRNVAACAVVMICYSLLLSFPSKLILIAILALS